MLSERFTTALVFATELHATQVRKGSGVPYIAHLLGVASLVLEYGGNEGEAIAGLLHDSIEDQGGLATRDEIYYRFGLEVTTIVEGCTDTFTTPKPPWKKRKEDYLEHLKTASDSVKLVSCADKLYNARSILKDYQEIGEELWTRFKGKKEGTLWYYQSLVEVFSTHFSSPIVQELRQVVTQLTTLANSF